MRTFVAEGVETKKQLDFLQANSCEEGQGFYFSKALDPVELEKFLKKSEWDNYKCVAVNR